MTLSRFAPPRALGAALLAAAVLRIGLAVRVYPSRWNIDPDYYDKLAVGLVTKGELTSDVHGRHSAFREPGWPILLAADYALFGRGIAGIMILQLALALGGIVLLWDLGRRFLSPRAGLAAAWLAAGHPALTYYTVYPLRELGYLFFVLASVGLLLRAERSRTVLSFAAAGAVNAWTALVSTTFLPFAAAAPAALKLLRPKVPLKGLAAFYLVLAAVYGVWPLRNYVYWKSFIPGTLYAAENVYKTILVPHEARSTPVERSLLDNDPVYKRWMELAPVDPGEADRLLKAEIRRRLAQDPLLIVRNAPFNAWKLWRPVPYVSQVRPWGYEPDRGLIWWASLLSDGWLIPLGWAAGLALAFGLRGAWRSDRALLVTLGWLWIGLLTTAHAFSFANTRHRLPAMGFIILFAGSFAARAYERLREAS